MASLMEQIRKWLGMGKKTEPFSRPERRKMCPLALHSVPAQSPQTTNALCARGEEPKATEFDCGANSCLIDRAHAIRVPSSRVD